MSKKNEENQIISELNVVPYIDVMLVLLIIFMVTAPLLQHSIEVDLPNTANKNQDVDTVSEPIVITVNENGDYFVNTSTSALNIRELTIEIIALKKINKNKTKVYIRGDKDATYQNVINAISVMKKNGLNNIGLMTNSL